MKKTFVLFPVVFISFFVAVGTFAADRIPSPAMERRKDFVPVKEATPLTSVDVIKCELIVPSQSNYVEGAGIPLTVVITNASGIALGPVPWNVTEGLVGGSSTSVRAGVFPASGAVAPGTAVARIAFTWPATLGDHRFSLTCDALNTLETIPKFRGNNSQGSPIFHVKVKMVTEGLDFIKVRNAIGNHTAIARERVAGIEPPRLCRNVDIVAPSEQSALSGQPGWNGGGAVAFRLGDCRGPAREAYDLDAFLGFKLKNGWKVKGIGTTDATRDHGNWNITTMPAGDNAHIRIHIWGDKNAWVMGLLNIGIEGPSSMDPYIEGSPHQP